MIAFFLKSAICTLAHVYRQIPPDVKNFDTRGDLSKAFK